jgi:hypothetical protein
MTHLPTDVSEPPMQDPPAPIGDANGTRKHICVVTPCYNEVENVRELHAAIRDVFAKLPKYT